MEDHEFIKCKFCLRELNELSFSAHNRARCKDCMRQYKADYLGRYYVARREQIVKQRRQYREKNGELFKEAARQREKRYYRKNKAAIEQRRRERVRVLRQERPEEYQRVLKAAVERNRRWAPGGSWLAPHKGKESRPGGLFM